MVLSHRIIGPFKWFCQIVSLDRLTGFQISNHWNNQLVSWFRITERIRWFCEFESPDQLNSFMTSNLSNFQLVSCIRITGPFQLYCRVGPLNPLFHTRWDNANICHFRSRSTFLKILDTLTTTIVWTRHRFSSIPRLESKLIESECGWSY